MANKINVIHFHNGAKGGVLSVIKNLVGNRQSSNIVNHVIYVIDEEKNPHFEKFNLEGAETESVFRYNKNHNFYYSAKMLSKLVYSEDCVLVTHDWFELGMIANLGLNNPVVQVVHGNYEYYFNLAIRYEKFVDFRVCVSAKIHFVLSDQYKVENQTVHINFPVKSVGLKNVTKRFDCFKIGFFVSDLMDINKRFCLIPEIDAILRSRNILVKWNIAGGNFDVGDMALAWGLDWREKLLFWGELINPEEIRAYFDECNFMILPSLKEGLPVSVVESMLQGIIPIVSRWNGSMDEIVVHGKSGFVLKDNSTAEDFADVIGDLNNYSLDKISENAQNLATMFFDANRNTLLYERIYYKAIVERKDKPKEKIIGSRLDVEKLPNFLVFLVRKLLKSISCFCQCFVVIL